MFAITGGGSLIYCTSAIPVIGAVTVFCWGAGSTLISIKNNYVSVNSWQYINVHRSTFQEYVMQSTINETDNHVYITEIHKNQDGSLDWNESVTYDAGNIGTME